MVGVIITSAFGTLYLERQLKSSPKARRQLLLRAFFGFPGIWGLRRAVDFLDPGGGGGSPGKSPRKRLALYAGGLGKPGVQFCEPK